MVAKKDPTMQDHPNLPAVPNLHVMLLLRSLKSRGFVRETYAWRHYYWFLTQEGIDYIREKLAIAAEVQPQTLIKRDTHIMRESGGRRGGRREGGDDRRGGYRRDGGRGRGFGGPREGAGGFGGSRSAFSAGRGRPEATPAL